jgi:hypothetical protein
MEPRFEKLASDKTILREFASDGSLVREMHSYGRLDVAIDIQFEHGKKVEELYFSKGRMASRRTYEKVRLSFPDMPPADFALEDVSGSLVTELRRDERRRKAEAERRLEASVESRYARPASTNWLRIISGNDAHLVEFESRDWKALAREKALPTGRTWLTLFGFDGPPTGSSVAEGLITGYEIPVRREEMLDASRRLLEEVQRFTPEARDPTWGAFHFRKQPKPRKPKPLAWGRILPTIIEFLERLCVPTVTIFNNHR